MPARPRSERCRQQALAAAVRNPTSGPGEPSTPPTIVIISLSPRPSAAGCRRLLERRRVAPGAGGAVQLRPLQVGALGGLDVLRPAAPRRRARAPGAPARTRTRAARGAGRAGSSRPDGPSRPRRSGRPRGSRSPAPPRGRAGRGTSSVRSATSSTPARSARLVPREHHVRLQQGAAELDALVVQLGVERLQGAAGGLRARLDRVVAVHQHLGLDDRDETRLLRERRITGERVRVHPDAVPRSGGPRRSSRWRATSRSALRARGTRRSARAARRAPRSPSRRGRARAALRRGRP